MPTAPQTITSRILSRAWRSGPENAVEASEASPRPMPP